MSFRSIVTLGWILSLTLSNVAFAGAGDKFKVCMANLNSDEESILFQKYLNAQDFEFVELTSMGDYNKHWFDAACESGIQCDIFLISGHFTGQFTGGGKKSLPLEQMERHQCKHTCDGILKNPVETFLFGCNTLSTKDLDHRTKEVYLDVLREHTKLRRITRERTVEARYGDYGENFRQRTRFAFSGSPRVYGFWSVDPTGAQMAPFLEEYFKNKGNYTDWITKAKLQKVADQNGTLANAWSNLNFLQCSGMNPKDPEYSDRQRLCTLLDENVATLDKLKMIRGMAATQSFQKFLPNIEHFFDENPPSTYGAPELAELKLLQGVALGKQSLESSIDSTLGNQLRLNLIELGAKIGWFDSKDRANRRYEILKRSLRTLASTTAGADDNLLCDLSWEDADSTNLTLSDIAPEIFADANKLASLRCVNAQALLAKELKAAQGKDQKTKIATYLLGIDPSNADATAVLQPTPGN